MAEDNGIWKQRWMKGERVMDAEELGCSLALKAGLMYDLTRRYYSAPAPAKQVGAVCCPEAFINKAVQSAGLSDALSPRIQILKSRQCCSVDNRYTNSGH